MKLTKVLIAIISFFSFLTANAQIDAVKIASAKKAIENKEYQIALQTLGEVSSEGKKNKMFLLCNAEAYYNFLMYDSAEVYYKKYILLDSTNKDVTRNLDDIFFKRKKGFSKVIIDLLTSQLDDKKNNDKDNPVEYHISLNYISTDSGNVRCMIFFNRIKKVELEYDKIALYTFGKDVTCIVNNDCNYGNSFFISGFDSDLLKQIYISILRLASNKLLYIKK